MLTEAQSQLKSLELTALTLTELLRTSLNKCTTKVNTFEHVMINTEHDQANYDM